MGYKMDKYAGLIGLIPSIFKGVKSFYGKFKKWGLKKKTLFLTLTPLSLFAIVELVDRYGHDQVVKAIHLLGAPLTTVISAL